MPSQPLSISYLALIGFDSKTYTVSYIIYQIYMYPRRLDAAFLCPVLSSSHFSDARLVGKPALEMHKSWSPRDNGRGGVKKSLLSKMTHFPSHSVNLHQCHWTIPHHLPAQACQYFIATSVNLALMSKQAHPRRPHTFIAYHPHDKPILICRENMMYTVIIFSCQIKCYMVVLNLLL